MATSPEPTLVRIRGPIARADLPGLCERVCAVLARSSGGTVVCDVSGIEPDAVSVEALARLQVGARRQDCRVRLEGASSRLRSVVELIGLAGVLDLEPV